MTDVIILKQIRSFKTHKEIFFDIKTNIN
jgi:hypothetical protein